MGVEKITYNLNQLINQAIMTKKPLIIVEGEDDVPFYGKLTMNKHRVLASELIKSTEDKFYTPGCDGVIQIIKDAQEIIEENSSTEKYFLGIIDRDCRPYIEGTDLDYKCLFKLEYYSFESHFITHISTKNLISYITSVGVNEISDYIVDYYMNKANERFEELYYVSIDSLKGRCEEEYNSIVTLDIKPEALYQSEGLKIKEILRRKEELDEYAKEKRLIDIEYRKIIKGKWHLYAYVKEICENINDIKDRCKDDIIEQCDYCRNSMYDKCKWKPKIKVTRSEYINCIINLNYDKEPEIEYIKEKLLKLG